PKIVEGVISAGGLLVVSAGCSTSNLATNSLNSSILIGSSSTSEAYFNNSCNLPNALGNSDNSSCLNLEAIISVNLLAKFLSDILLTTAIVSLVVFNASSICFLLLADISLGL